MFSNSLKDGSRTAAVSPLTSISRRVPVLDEAWSRRAITLLQLAVSCTDVTWWHGLIYVALIARTKAPESTWINQLQLFITSWVLLIHILSGLLSIVFQCFSLRFTYKQCHVTASLPTCGTVSAHFRRGWHSFAECADFHGILAFWFMRFLPCRIARRGATLIWSGLCLGWLWQLLQLVPCCMKVQPW